jgi:hypothetical protein
MVTACPTTSVPTLSVVVAERPAEAERADHGPEAVDARAQVAMAAAGPEAADDRAVEPAAEDRDPAAVEPAEREQLKAVDVTHPEGSDDGSTHLIQ